MRFEGRELGLLCLILVVLMVKPPYKRLSFVILKGYVIIIIFESIFVRHSLVFLKELKLIKVLQTLWRFLQLRFLD